MAFFFSEIEQKNQYCLYNLSYLILTSCLLNCCADTKSVTDHANQTSHIITLNASVCPIGRLHIID